MPPSYGLPSQKGSPLGSELLTFAPERHRVDSEQFGGPFHADAEPEHSPDVFRFQLTQAGFPDQRIAKRIKPSAQAGRGTARPSSGTGAKRTQPPRGKDGFGRR